MSDERPQIENQEICVNCSESVAFGSGRFVNRVPIFDDYDTRVEQGRPYPAGAFVCGECDAEYYEDEKENYDPTTGLIGVDERELEREPKG